MKRVAWLCSLLALFVASPLLAADEAPISAEFRADLHRLIEVTDAVADAREMGLALIKLMTANLKVQHPEISSEALDALPAAVEEVFDKNVASFEDMLIVLYSKYFTDAEVRQLVQFYSSDVGRKLNTVMPELAKDSMALGRQWGLTVGPQVEKIITEKLREKGYDI